MNKKTFPEWDEKNLQESLNRVYQWAVDSAADEIEWYQERKEPKRKRSQQLRFFSILFATIGALCPLIDATNIFEVLQSRYQIFSANIAFSQWGYLFLALAAALVGFDSYSGYSTGWMRYIVTQISLEQALKEFQYDWIMLKSQQQNNPANINAPIFLQRAKDFTLQIGSQVKQETDTWVAEFQRNISQLEKVLKTETEARRPGSIKVSVTNCTDFDKISVRLNDSQVKELVGVTEGIINTVSPGAYDVMVIGKKGGKESKASQVVEVQADKMVSAEFTLPAL